MKFRIFSLKHKLYTNSPFWPSNQRTTSEFVLRPDGKILEIIDSGACGASVEICDSRNYIVEPWTGYFDSKGKKIYRGDILIATNDPLYESEVIWNEGSFVCRSTKNHDDQALLDMDARVWKRVVVKGNIHDAEYTD